MARPIKQGLSYFPLDVDFFTDIKVRKIRRAQGEQSISILIFLLCMGYRDMGFYMRWDEEVCFLVADEVGANEAAVCQVVDKAVQVGFFDENMFSRYRVLTSKGIQQRFYIATEGRKEVIFYKEYLLIDVSKRKNTLVTELTGVETELMPLVMNKVKESKRKESKLKTPPTPSRGECACVTQATSLNFQDISSVSESAAKQDAWRAAEQGVTTSKVDDKIRLKKQKTQETRIILELGFNKFWEAYPKKLAKKPALQAYVKLAPDDELLGLMLEKLTTLARTESWQREGGRYIPMPATWINQKRWEDEAVETPKYVYNYEHGGDSF